MTDIPDPNRAQKAYDKRVEAAALSTKGQYDDHLNNQDEKAPYIFSFTKGLEHKPNGLVAHPTEYEKFIVGTETHDPEVFGEVIPYRGTYENEGFGNTPPDGELSDVRRWESPTAGFTYVMQGPDPFAVTMPPAPVAGSAEFAAEMAEVYQMALLRDRPVGAFMSTALVNGLVKPNGSAATYECKDNVKVVHHEVSHDAARLNGMRWFAGTEDDGLDADKQARRRFGVTQSAANLFRGVGEDEWDTPFLSQFMVMGSGGADHDIEKRAKGEIAYGAQRIRQSVRVAHEGLDYMTYWPAWLNVQNAANIRDKLADGDEFVPGAHRFMSRLRDLATYVHDDQLYQAYLNAALLLLSEKYEFDKGIPFHGNSDTKFAFPGAPAGDDNRDPFALFGGPHLLTLVTEVSSRALKAVRLQKFSVHRRLRPEAVGALFETIYSGYNPNSAGVFPQTGNSAEAKARKLLGKTLARYTFVDPADPASTPTDPALVEILEEVRAHNAPRNPDANGTLLLPMAFPEGSPMHPSYGAGHATVAGACVTLLKAFFDMGSGTDKTMLVERNGLALVPGDCAIPMDHTAEMLATRIPEGLTLEGELNKLMWNISNARNIAGVHYYSDYIESALLGEAITIGLLREQMLTHHAKESASMTLPLLVERTLPSSLLEDGTIAPTEMVRVIRITNTGQLEKVA